MNRLLVIVLACLAVALYVRSPIDLLPDAAGLFGVVDDLLVALGVTWWLRHRGAPPRPRTTARQRARGPGDRAHTSGASRDESTAASGDEAPADPYAVLGVHRGATRDEIRDAYRAQMKLYHPDRVADLGPELQQVAHRKAIEIQRAFEEIG
ncbi:MAG: DUF1232 domain-containing protein [Deltaproteobacteria bacterium]|nr:DUF1232 domain-containing protein [Deltaproteobacteria bacterium]